MDWQEITQENPEGFSHLVDKEILVYGFDSHDKYESYSLEEVRKGKHGIFLEVYNSDLTPTQWAEIKPPINKAIS